MNIGVICEGHTDRVVIENILKGLKGIDSSQIVQLRPQSDFDETDLADMPIDSFGGWSAVKDECESRIKIDEFLSLEGNDHVVIQIDSAESDDYNVSKPVKNAAYSTILRSDIIAKIDEWLNGLPSEKVLYAIAIEETEAWILTIYEQRSSTASADPKARLKRTLERQEINYKHSPKDFKKISSQFSKKKNFSKFNYFKNNQSLKDFCEEVNQKIKT